MDKDQIVEIEEQEEENKVYIGKQIRKLRTVRGISLQSLSEDLGMSYSYLSGLENEKHSITLNNLQRIANYFKVDLISLLSVNDQETLYIEKDKRVSNEMDDGIIFQIVTNENIKNLQISFVTIPPHSPSERNIHKHVEGDEFIYVIEGEVIVIVEDTKYVLKKEDCLIFSSDKEHTIYTEGKPSKIMLVSSPPYGNRIWESPIIFKEDLNGK